MEGAPSEPVRRGLRRLVRVAAVGIGLFALSRRAWGEPGIERSFLFVLEHGSAPACFRLDASLPAERAIRAEDVVIAAGEIVAGLPPRPKKVWIGLVTVATVLGSAYNSFSDGKSQRFHFTNEEWFGRNTYAGGGDKASHLVSYNVVARLLTEVYSDLGVSTDKSRLLGSAVSTLAGLVTEIGDGTTRYGFSYEDFVTDALGAAAALATAHYGLDDLVGVRAGLVPKPTGQPRPGAFGKDYTQEIYTADLKIAGLAKRLHFSPGPARFLLLSATYGVKGYPYSEPSVRERQLGVEIGLHLSEFARLAGLPTTHWWGRIAYFLLDTIRLPYTSIGYQYDVNHKKWRGPGIGDSFPGGP